MNAFIRSAHRWLSIVFMIAVVVNVGAVVLKAQALWIGLLALAPLILMMISGLWLFALPYVSRHRAGRKVSAS